MTSVLGPKKGVSVDRASHYARRAGLSSISPSHRVLALPSDLDPIEERASPQHEPATSKPPLAANMPMAIAPSGEK